MDTVSSKKPTIRELVNNSHLSKKDISLGAGLSYAYLHMLFRPGVTGARLEAAQRLARFFGYTVDEIDWCGIDIHADHGRQVGGTNLQAFAKDNTPVGRVCNECFIALPLVASSDTTTCEDCS